MSFQVEITELPSHAGNFADLRDYVGKDALAIRHPHGPWTYALYKTPLAETKLFVIETYEVGGSHDHAGRNDRQGHHDAAWPDRGVGKARCRLLC